MRFSNPFNSFFRRSSQIGGDSGRRQRLGPDFLGIGLQKAATRWVYDALDGFDSFWLPVVKEVHHFDSSADHPGNLEMFQEVGEQIQHHFRRESRRRVREGLRPLDYRDRLFADRALEYYQSARGEHEYLRLFEPAEEKLSGDVTPAYSTLGKSEVVRVHEMLPDAKIILVVRDPIRRLWSAFNMDLRKEARRNYDLNPSVFLREYMEGDALMRRLQEYVEDPNVLARSFPSLTYETWREVYGEDRMLVINFDDIVSQPATILVQLAAFFDVSGDRGVTMDVSNRKQGQKKLQMDGTVYEFLENFFEPEFERCRETFGSLVDSWFH